MIDQAVAERDTNALVRRLVALAVVYVGLSFSFRLGARAGERAAEMAAHRLRVELVRRVLDPRGGAENGRLPGEDPASGVVELDGVPLPDLDPAELRTAVLVAAHDAALFDGTLGENIGAI